MDWQKLVKDLREAGVPVRKIAQHAGVSVTAIYDLLYGRSKEPRGTAAIRIASLAASVLGEANESGGDQMGIGVKR